MLRVEGAEDIRTVMSLALDGVGSVSSGSLKTFNLFKASGIQFIRQHYSRGQDGGVKELPIDQLPGYMLEEAAPGGICGKHSSSFFNSSQAKVSDYDGVSAVLTI